MLAWTVNVLSSDARSRSYVSHLLSREGSLGHCGCALPIHLYTQIRFISHRLLTDLRAALGFGGRAGKFEACLASAASSPYMVSSVPKPLASVPVTPSQIALQLSNGSGKKKSRKKKKTQDSGRQNTFTFLADKTKL